MSNLYGIIARMIEHDMKLEKIAKKYCVNKEDVSKDYINTSSWCNGEYERWFEVEKWLKRKTQKM